MARQRQLPTATRVTRLLTTVTIAYWTALFVATHLPRAHLPAIAVSDKLAHFGAYLLLGALAATVLRLRGARRLTAAAVSLGVIALYGACDELLQIPVGRHGDVWDWVADLAGAAAGVALVSLIARGWRRSR